MAKRISKKNEGQLFHLGFASPYNPLDIEDVLLVKVEGTGDDARATFKDEEIGEWEAYRYKGRWAYGSSAERLIVIK